MLGRLVAIPASVSVLSGLALGIVLAVACFTIGSKTLGYTASVGFVTAIAIFLTGMFGLWTRRMRFMTLLFSAVTFLGLCALTGFLFIGAKETSLLKSDPGAPIPDRNFNTFFQEGLINHFDAASAFGECSASLPVSCPKSRAIQEMMKRWTTNPNTGFTGCPASSGIASLWCSAGLKFSSDVYEVFAKGKLVAGALGVITLLIFLFAIFSSKKKDNYRAKYSSQSAQRRGLVV